MPDLQWQERPLACIVPKPGAEVTLQAVLERLLASGFAKWQLPDRFEFVDQIPRTATGKFKKTVLRDQFASVESPA